MNYWLSFGASASSGLAPTFIQFRTTAGGTLAPPTITEPGSFGLYYFGYTALTQVAFICDGATSGLALSDRYVQGVLDPFDNFGFSLNVMGGSMSTMGNSMAVMGGSLNVMGVSLSAQGNTLSALGVLVAEGLTLGVLNFSLGVQLYSLAIQGASLLGDNLSSFGTDVSDPASVFGFLKRALEDVEGNETYTKATGNLQILSRGSSQLLASKTISDSTTETTKT